MRRSRINTRKITILVRRKGDTVPDLEVPSDEHAHSPLVREPEDSDPRWIVNLQEVELTIQGIHDSCQSD